MKVKRMMTVALVLAALACSAVDEDCSDAKIKRMLAGSNGYIDNPDAAERMFQNARRRCGGDTNRFARLLCEVARTNDAWIAADMIGSLGVYGTAAELPFLYSMATNAQHGATAVRAILRLEGVTSNSVAVVGCCLANKAIQEPERLRVCQLLVELACAGSMSADARARALSFLHNHVRVCDYPEGLDRTLVFYDTRYRMSRRRLANLRAVYAHGVDRWDLPYVTNAINELVAYPEAELPE